MQPETILNCGCIEGSNAELVALCSGCNKHSNSFLKKECDNNGKTRSKADYSKR